MLILKANFHFKTLIELDTPYVKGTFIDSHKPTVALYNALNTLYHLFNILSYVFSMLLVFYAQKKHV